MIWRTKLWRSFTERVAALLLTPDGNPERRWCHNGNPCCDASPLECLTMATESNNYNLMWNDMREKPLVTIFSSRAVAVRKLEGGYRKQDNKSRETGEFHAFISPTYICQLLLSPGFMCTVLFMYSRLPLKCFSRSRQSWCIGPLVLWDVLGWSAGLFNHFRSLAMI